MSQKGLTGFFENFLKADTLFQEKKVLQTAYTPEIILHREEQIKQIADILAPAIKMDKPSNIFIYGKSGTGKTVSTKFITEEILKVAAQNSIPLKVAYVNCKLKRVADTEYRLIAQIASEFGPALPPTGLPTDEIYKLFFQRIDSKRQLVILVLDEIDQLVKKAGDEILYNLTRINEELKQSQLSIIGLSNDLVFIDNIDPRVKSSLSEEEILFSPYNALQLQDILKQRAIKAFKPGVLEEGVIEKCAAYAAREHGDARRALELLRVSGEFAERNGFPKVSMDSIDLAEDQIERDRITGILTTQPKQVQATMHSIFVIARQKKAKSIFTGEIYELYKTTCQRIGLRPLTQRRLSDIIGELEMQGIINARIISKGRYGRTREITVGIPASSLPKLQLQLEEALDL